MTGSRLFRLVGGPLDGTRKLLAYSGWPPNGISVYEPPRSWVTADGFGITAQTGERLVYYLDRESLPGDVEGPRDLVYVYDWRSARR